jgi:hypothetical protein
MHMMLQCCQNLWTGARVHLMLPLSGCCRQSVWHSVRLRGAGAAPARQLPVRGARLDWCCCCCCATGGAGQQGCGAGRGRGS